MKIGASSFGFDRRGVERGVHVSVPGNVAPASGGELRDAPRADSLAKHVRGSQRAVQRALSSSALHPSHRRRRVRPHATETERPANPRERHGVGLGEHAVHVQTRLARSGGGRGGGRTAAHGHAGSVLDGDARPPFELDRRGERRGRAGAVLARSLEDEVPPVEIRLHALFSAVFGGDEAEQTRHVFLRVPRGGSCGCCGGGGGLSLACAPSRRRRRRRRNLRRRRRRRLGPAKRFEVHPRHEREPTIVKRPTGTGIRTGTGTETGMGIGTGAARAQHAASLTVEREKRRRSSASRRTQRRVERAYQRPARGSSRLRGDAQPRAKVSDGERVPRHLDHARLRDAASLFVAMTEDRGFVVDRGRGRVRAQGIVRGSLCEDAEKRNESASS